jgi:S-adenosylmethionine-diacylgycerolhomoserine-N-methlytransferase
MITAQRMGGAGDHMDRIYRRQRHIYDLTRKYYLLGRDAMIRDLAPPPDGTVLEAGCGTGRNLIRAARIYPQARFFGLDISSAMLETARANIARAELADRITLGEGDATDFDPVALFGRQRFDRIFLSYTLSMIPDWVGVLDHAARMIGADGQLHLIDFGQLEGLPPGFRSVLFAWLRKFDVTPSAYLQEALQAMASHDRLSLHWQARYHGYAWTARLEPR